MARYNLQFTMRGVTGMRKGFLLDSNHQRREYSDRVLAESEANRLNLQNDEGATLQFKYEVKPC